MNKNKIWNGICVFALLLQAISEVLLTVFVLQLNVLPGRYVILLCTVMAVLLLLTSSLLLLHGKKPVSTVRRIIGLLLAAVILCCCLIGAKTVLDTTKTLHTVTTTPPEVDENGMNVFVRADDPAQNLADTANYVYAYITEYEEEATAQALLLIQEQTGGKVAQILCDSTQQLVDELLGGNADAIVINSAALIVLSEDEEGYMDLFDKVRILHSFPMSQLGVTEPPTEPPTEPTEPSAGITQETFAVYLSGSDTRSKTLKKGRSDVNILAIVNPQTKQVLLLNTPRDYYVPNPVGNGKMDKLTNCGLYGPENSMKILGTLYNIPVNYYAQINFTGVETLVDAIGGITVESTQTFTCGEYREFQIVKGKNKLNGEEALAFARERYHVKGGDNGRGQNQMRVITAIINKVTSGSTIVSNYSSILSSMEGMFRTSVSAEEISALFKMQLDDMASWNVKSFAVTGEGGSEKTYSAPGHRSYVMHPHQHMVDHAAMLAQKVFNGETLTDEDVVAPKAK